MVRWQATLVVCALLTAVPAAAQAPQTTQPGTDKPAARGAPAVAEQRKLVTLIAQGGMAEVAAGQLAQRRARTSSVRQFADQMVTDHTKGNADLAAAARQANIAAPTDMSAQDQDQINALGNMADTAFEQAYIQRQVKDHQSMIELHRQLLNVQVPALADYARATLPKLEEHLRMAQVVDRELKASGRP